MPRRLTSWRKTLIIGWKTWRTVCDIIMSALWGFRKKLGLGDPTAFVECWLIEVFGKGAFSPFFTVEKVNHTLGSPLPPGPPPKQRLSQLLHYRDRDTILRCARECATIQYNGTRVSFYPDFSAAVQRSCAKFVELKKCLCNLQLTYAMLYPPKLRVSVGRQTHFFESAREASAWFYSEKKFSITTKLVRLANDPYEIPWCHA